MRNQKVGVIEHLEITSNIDVGKMIQYTQRILMLTSLKKYKKVLDRRKE